MSIFNDNKTIRGNGISCEGMKLSEDYSINEIGRWLVKGIKLD
jgi:hypothetical protein